MINILLALVLSFHGGIDAMYSAIHLKFPCVKVTPEGFPVVPEVYRIVAISLKSTGETISLIRF